MRIAVLIILLALASKASGAGFEIGTGAGAPGTVVTVELSFTGDGVTSAAEVIAFIDSAKLYVDSAPGQIPGAAVGGPCAWNGASTISSLIHSGTTAPIPQGQTVLCNLPISIRANAIPGRTVLRLASQACFSSSGSVNTCSAVNGWIDILGTVPLQGPTQPEETTELAFLLTEEASEQLEANLLASNLSGKTAPQEIPAFRAFPPRSVRHLARRPLGDHAARLARKPNSAEAAYFRYYIADFADSTSRDSALSLLGVDPNVIAAYAAEAVEFSLVSTAAGFGQPKAQKTTFGFVQEQWPLMALPQAWALAEGWGLVGVLDNGIDVNHPELRSRTGTASTSGDLVLGGNFLPYFSANHGPFGQNPFSVDEVQPANLGVNSGPCDTDSDGWIEPQVAGHGSHVAGLVAANALDGAGARGACVHCGLAIHKSSYANCVAKANTNPPEYFVASSLPVNTHMAPHFVELLEDGVQVISMSFGFGSLTCPQGHVWCNNLDRATLNDVLLVAAAGNNRGTPLRFPAMDKSTVSVGGVEMDGQTFWDESPGTTTNCPYPGLNTECGSNYSNALARPQELVAPAKSVFSTAYASYPWNTDIGCGDWWGPGSTSDGFGTCTGTSMSTPQVAGIFGLLRSINPMARRGEVSQAGPYGVRNVVSETASRAGAAFDYQRFGYGVPDAGKAASRMLGTSRDEQIKNRVTPLFALYSTGASDYAAVSSPQLAMALSLYQIDAYSSQPVGAPTHIAGYSIPGYPSYPNTEAGTPRARALILTTSGVVREGYPNAVPLMLLEKKGPSRQRDFILLTSQSVVNSALSQGYEYAGRQGYIYEMCSPYPACRPNGTSQLHLRCRAGGECAVFLDAQSKWFSERGYSSVFPGMTNSVLGLAYTLQDSDGDGLPNAMEFILGTDISLTDSDGDSISDSVEYPFGGIPVSDPCDGPNECPGLYYYMFGDGFE